MEMGNVNRMVYVPVSHQETILSVEKEMCPITGWFWVGAAVNFTASDPSLSKQGNSYAQVVVEFKIARQWQPYLFRIVFFVFLLNVSSVLTFLLPPIDGFNDRLR
jgi:hypothetical protein